MAKPATRLKTKAQTYVPQTRDDAAADIRKIGDIQRQFARQAASMNDAIAEITHAHQPMLDALGEQIKTLQEGVQGYCEAHRDDLTDGGKVKPPTSSPAKCNGASARPASPCAARIQSSKCSSVSA